MNYSKARFAYCDKKIEISSKEEYDKVITKLLQIGFTQCESELEFFKQLSLPYIPFLYVNIAGVIHYGIEPMCFYRHDYKALTVSEVLSTTEEDEQERRIEPIHGFKELSDIIRRNTSDNKPIVTTISGCAAEIFLSKSGNQIHVKMTDGNITIPMHVSEKDDTVFLDNEYVGFTDELNQQRVGMLFSALRNTPGIAL